MKDIIEYVIGIIIAFSIFTLLSKVSLSLSQLINSFTIVVIYFAVTKSETYGALMGTAMGLIQDSFSLGILGVSGLTKTIIGFSAGYISHKINVVPFFRNFIFLFVLMIGEIALTTFLYYFISSEYTNQLNSLNFFQPLCTAFLGSLFFLGLRMLKKKSYV